MKTVRALIADDESLARIRLRRLLQNAPQIKIIGECADGKETIRSVRKLSPDVLFLDVQMPEMNGFQVLECLLPEKLPYIIFVTAYDQYALKAFEFYALDYLLKPFNEERILRSVRRLRDKFDGLQKEELGLKIGALLKEMQAQTEYRQRFMIRKNHRSEIVAVREIHWIKAENKCARIHMEKVSYLLPQSLLELERTLDPRIFVRTHRSTMVNVNFIKEIQTDPAAEPRAILMDGTKIPIGRTFHQKLLAILLRLE